MAEYYQVAQGDCLANITTKYGFEDYHAIWDHAKNAQLKQLRQNPNILYPGDILYIPDKEEKEESRGTTQQHQFQVGDPTILLRTVIKDGKDQPIANAPYVLKLPGQVYTGTTGADGLLEKLIPLKAETAELTLTQLGLTWTLHLGHLDPIETVSGVQARLNALGYDCGSPDGTENDQLRAALMAFQRDNGLQPVDGTRNASSIAKLKEKYGC